MNNIEYCPICKGKHVVIPNGNSITYKCNKGVFIIHESVLENIDDITKERRLNAIFNNTIHNPQSADERDAFKFNYYENDDDNNNDMVNVYQLMKNYPINIIDKLNRILFNISILYPLMSDMFNENSFSNNFRYLYIESDNYLQEYFSIISALYSLKYIEPTDHTYNYYRIAVDGWKKIESLKKMQVISKKAFVAMSFDSEMAETEQAISQALKSAGYNAIIIKDKEHNNYIMPEIFHQIKNSKFLVLDVSKQNYGAYFEAGYAQGLGKEVIVCCKKSFFDNPETKPHFDILQKSMILWTDEKDLIARLKRRIEATIR